MESYKIINKEEYLKIIEVSENELKEIIKNKSISYRKYLIPNKKYSKCRSIYIITNKSDIYRLQRNLQKRFFNNFYFPSNVYGFVKQKSYIDYMVPHCSRNLSKYYLRLDINSFFDTITIKQIKECLNFYIDDTCDNKEKKFIVDSIAEIVTLDDKLIQGAITSPVISNLVFRRLDIRIERFCEKNNITYTRYADDMLFSGFDDVVHKGYFINMIASIIKKQGFSLNYNKTLKMYEELSLNGYVIGEEIRLSRKKYKAVNLILFYLNRREINAPISRVFKYNLINKLAGYRSLFIQVLRYVYDSRNIDTIQKKISEIEKGIDKLVKFDEGVSGSRRADENKILIDIYKMK